MGGLKRGPNWRKQKSACKICGKEMLNGSLQRHVLTMHKEGKEKCKCRGVRDTGTYFVNVATGEDNKCPVPGCGGGGADKFSFYQHLAWQHNKATIRLQGDENLPKCELCEIHSKNIP